MSLGTVLLIVVILVLIGVLATWPHARSWGDIPSGVVGAVPLVVVVVFDGAPVAPQNIHAKEMA
jgi:Protein of unknown function (DUF3309)